MHVVASNFGAMFRVSGTRVLRLPSLSAFFMAFALYAVEVAVLVAARRVKHLLWSTAMFWPIVRHSPPSLPRLLLNYSLHPCSC
jgi:hypothetical protein